MSEIVNELRRLAPLDHSRVLGDVMRQAADEIERLQNNMWEVNEQSEFRACQIDKLDAELAECRRLLRGICDAIDEAPSWPNPVLSRLGVEWHKSAIVQAAKAAGGDDE